MTDDTDALEAEIDRLMLAKMPEAYDRMIAARGLRAAAAGPPAPAAKHRPQLSVDDADLAAACGSLDKDLGVKIVSEALLASVGPGEEAFDQVGRETVAVLRHIAPVNAREAMLAAQLVATHAACMDSYRLARSVSGPMRDVHLAQASRLSRTHAALSQALDRARGRDRQLVVFEYRHTPSLPRALD